MDPPHYTLPLHPPSGPHHCTLPLESLSGPPPTVPSLWTHRVNPPLYPPFGLTQWTPPLYPSFELPHWTPHCTVPLDSLSGPGGVLTSRDFHYQEILVLWWVFLMKIFVIVKLMMGQIGFTVLFILMRTSAHTFLLSLFICNSKVGCFFVSRSACWLTHKVNSQRCVFIFL